MTGSLPGEHAAQAAVLAPRQLPARHRLVDLVNREIRAGICHQPHQLLDPLHGYTAAFGWAAAMFAVGAIVAAALFEREAPELAVGAEPVLAH